MRLFSFANVSRYADQISSLHNPRAQGKVERSRRELRKKIDYDIVNSKSK